MVKFLHTSDWQLGMTRHFLSEGAQERFAQARFDAIRTMGKIAGEQNCQFMVVCGDAFESNQVDRKTIARAIEALKEVPVPVYILPGNHDCLNVASVYCSSVFVERKPEHVAVLECNRPVDLGNSVEIIGAPWASKRPVTNPIENALSGLVPSSGATRILVGHGIIDIFAPDKEAAALIETDALEQAINDKKVDFVALGDRHSLTKVGSSDRIWYSGTPEATDFRETESGNVHIVEIEGDRVQTTAIKVGQWRFIEFNDVNLNTQEDVEALRRTLEDTADKDRTVAKMSLTGTLTLSLMGTLQACLEAARDVFGAFEVREDELLVVPDDADFADLGFSGFADATVERLRKEISETGEGEEKARNALMLLLRLAEGAS